MFGGCQLFSSVFGAFPLAVPLVVALLMLSPLHAEPIDPAQLPPVAAHAVDFGRDVYPLLKRHCLDCHQGQQADSGYQLDVRGEILGESNGQPLVEVGDSTQSRLIHLVAGVLEETMPPAGEGEPLSADQVGILRAWIDQGLSWDDQLLPPPSPQISHWSFLPILRPLVPAIRNQDWAQTPVDVFISAEHETRGLAPAPPASRQTLARRVALDLTGLPPTPGQLEEFLRNPAPNAYSQFVERLLASPRYGERWGRHWLDLARWAESEGYESNHLRTDAWRYRDYVIQSFNDDKPYDRFLREQIAGDELVPYADEHLIATGFLASARLSSNEEDKKLQRNAVLVDIVNATGEAVMGLTIACAQCHNHKFDPITQRDYYALQGLFVTGQVNNLALRDPQLWETYRASLPEGYEAAVELRDLIFEQAKRRTYEEVRKTLSPEMVEALDTSAHERTEHQRELARQADLKFQFTPAGFERSIPPEHHKLFEELKRKIDELEKQVVQQKPQTWGFYSPASSPWPVDVLPMKGFYPLVYEPQQLSQTRPHLLIRGDVHRRGPEVPAGWPAIFGSTPESIQDSPRSTFVDWLVDRGNPLTARVWVNRIWQYHFGRGIVATPGDFGLRGTPPSHPELLDYLAMELIDSGWSTKHIHRLIVLSSTYQQASRPSEVDAAIDPDNRYLWRWTLRRLEAEAIQDTVRQVRGDLDLAMGGQAQNENATARRSLYVLQKRDQMPEVQRLFDGPSANESCSRRHVSTVALQPLYLLNNPFMVDTAEKIADRVLDQSGDNPSRQLERAFQLVLGRLPEEHERFAAEAFFNAMAEHPQGDNPQPGRWPRPLVHFCHALLNLNEFVYLQ